MHPQGGQLSKLTKPVRGALHRLGYDVVRTNGAAPVQSLPPDCDEFTASVIERIDPYTLTSPERVMALVEAVRYLVRAEVPGDFVECGVWRGGSSMAMAPRSEGRRVGKGGGRRGGFRG